MRTLLWFLAGLALGVLGMLALGAWADARNRRFFEPPEWATGG